MVETFAGTVLFDNGVPAPEVQVRIFDQDDGQNQDDDLTLSVGISDKQGKFTVRYSSSRYLDIKTITTKIPRHILNWRSGSRSYRVPDLWDLYLPYLEFRYTYNGRQERHTEGMIPFVREFRLPELFTPKTTFVSSQHGFKFLNRFSGYPLPFSIPRLTRLTSVDSSYGLCGGMSSAACDFFLAERSIPEHVEEPVKGTSLYQYLYRRQIDTFGSFGKYVAKFAQWMALPEDTILGTQKRTYDQFEEISAELDDGNLVILGLVYVGGKDLAIWKNHQVLAHSYTEDGTKIKINIYDPNYPHQDDVFLEAERIPVGKNRIPGENNRLRTVWGLKCTQKMISRNQEIAVRGFFKMPYRPVEVPEDL